MIIAIGLFLFFYGSYYPARKGTPTPFMSVWLPGMKENPDLWHAVNRYYGRCMRFLGIVVTVLGIISLVVPVSFRDVYDAVTASVLFLGVGTVGFLTVLRWSSLL